MKRASLKTATALSTSTNAIDVTDRLLKTQDAGTVNLTPQPAAEARKPRRPKLSAAHAPSAAGTAAGKRPALHSGHTAVSASQSVAGALAVTRQALEALRAAQTEAPARYHLGVRYRLDALAHYLEQVSEFMFRQPE